MKIPIILPNILVEELKNSYKNRGCGMNFHETATLTVELELLKVPLRPSTMNQTPYHNRSCKRPRNIKCETIHKTQQSTLIWGNGEHITIND